MGKYFYIILITIAIICFLDFKSWFINLGIIESPSDLILSWTMLVIIWYSFETLKLRQATNKQVELQTAPCLVIHFKETSKNEFTVKNIGNGPALGISFEDTLIHFDDIKKTACYSLSIADKYNPILTPGEEKNIIAEMKIDGKNVFGTRVDMGTASIDPRFANLDLKLSITYHDIQNNKYESKIQTGKDKLRLLSYSKK